MTETASGAASQNGKSPDQGLTMRRIYTRAGVHPYDEVTWERRDVVMTNWRDGSVNFEQHGVEFPDFWSVNAANIVTTKYFRGAVGTPQREWSLKQLVDRVVGTYTAAGREHGYFAAEQDAEIFERELTHALVHQVFSFNSPVWFNVGTSSPQQVSACQPYDALVSTPAGLVPIGRLVDDDAVGAKVHDAHGTTTIVATKANGVKEVLRLHTAAGYALDATADHLVWRATDLDTGEFTVAGFIRPGDFLLHVDPDVGGQDRRLVPVSRVERLGTMEVYDIQTESGEYLSGNVRVHNCFILAVDDTMDSILEWYREEGLIFKGGSGAGVNLSRIRSSQEAPVVRRHGQRAGLVHARRRRLGRHHQVRWRHPARGEDGRPGRGSPGRRGLHRDQGARGREGPGAARCRVRHGPRRQGHRQRPVPER